MAHNVVEYEALLNQSTAGRVAVVHYSPAVAELHTETTLRGRPALEVGQALVKWLFETHGLQMLLTWLPSDNRAGQFMAARLGFQRIGETKGKVHYTLSRLKFYASSNHTRDTQHGRAGV